MKVSSFVSGSALVLAGWLGLTFVHEVSPTQYPSQRRGAASARQVAPPGASGTAEAREMAALAPAR